MSGVHDLEPLSLMLSLGVNSLFFRTGLRGPLERLHLSYPIKEEQRQLVIHHTCSRAKQFLKGKYHENLMSFENPKTFVCQQKQENNCLVLL